MEDRKFGDIGNTVSLQYGKGLYNIARWANIVTVHPISGPGVIDGLKSALIDIDEPRGVFIVTEMSSAGTLNIKDAVSIAESSDLVIGFVSQSNVLSNPALIQLTPGVKLSKSSDNLGQRYNTPESVVSLGADLAVVGRGITEAKDKLAATLEYKRELWLAYRKRVFGNT